MLPDDTNREGTRIHDVIVADDHPVVRAGLVAILGSLPNFRVVAQASDGVAAWDAICEHRPDFALLDVRMPRLGGLDVVERARKEQLETAFVMLTMLADGDEFVRAMDLEVDAYIVKGSSVDEILEALEAVEKGQRVIPTPEVRRTLSAPPLPLESEAVRRVLQSLTPTERIVLRHLAENKTSRQIALDLRVSVRTVQNHRANVCEKLALRGANKLLQFALENRSALSAASS